MWLKVGFAGMGTPATSAMAPGVQFFQAQTAPSYNYDPAKAKALLKEAGYPDGISLKLWTTNRTDYIRSAQFFKQQLEQVGIKITVTPMDSGMHNAKLFGVKDPKDAEFDLFYNGWSPSTGDADWPLRPPYATEPWVPAAYNVAY